MKTKLRFFILIMGWVLLAVFLTSGILYNSLTINNQNSLLAPIGWEEHLLMFNGGLSCSLTSADLQERREVLKSEIFPKMIKKHELTNGYVYYFDDEKGFSEKIMELIQKEKECCPFFKFDLSILPFGKGIALQISGSEAVKGFLEDFESSEAD